MINQIFQPNYVFIMHILIYICYMLDNYELLNISSSLNNQLKTHFQEASYNFSLNYLEMRSTHFTYLVFLPNTLELSITQ
jgi:hypothetical protein